MLVLPRALGKALARYLSTPRPGAQTGVAPDPRKLAQCLQPCDVLLVEGSTRISAAIKYLTQSTWSHAALYVGPQLGGADAEGHPHVFVEADIVLGVCKRSLAHYQTYHTRICRARHLAEADRIRIVQELTGKIGNQYDMKNVFDLARYLFPTPPIPARWRRNLIALGSGDPTRAICSSLIAEAFQNVGYPVLPIVTQDLGQDESRHRAAAREIFHIRHHSLYAPRDFDVSPYFEIVKPTLARGFDYRQIEWAGK
ncbi:MAG: Lipo-like protein [Ramlibacter sp.]|nr:Lipo-like protein [Ramlibacter sp.]